MYVTCCTWWKLSTLKTSLCLLVKHGTGTAISWVCLTHPSTPTSSTCRLNTTPLEFLFCSRHDCHGLSRSPSLKQTETAVLAAFTDHLRVFSRRGWAGVFPPSVLNQSFSNLHIMSPRPRLRRFLVGLSVYNSAQRYWLQIMINNNHIDKNGTLAITSDLICRPLCTLWCIQYHNHAWVHLVWKNGGGKKINGIALISKEKTSHLQILCWQRFAEQTQSRCPPRTSAEEAIDPPVNLFSCIGTAASPSEESDLPPPTAAIVSLH